MNKQEWREFARELWFDVKVNFVSELKFWKNPEDIRKEMMKKEGK